MAGESSQRKNLRKWLLIALTLLGLTTIAVLIFDEISRVRIYRPPPSQNAQFHSMEAALELFKNQFQEYPPSDANDPLGRPYCGSMKLAEAMMGRDLLGFHSKSVFRADAKDANGVGQLYAPTDLANRKGPFLPPESIDACTLGELYGPAYPQPVFDADTRVLCDVFSHKFKTGHEGGMPVLYYKADTSKTAHDVNDPNNPGNIYDYRDNHALLALGVPHNPKAQHPLYANPKLFYKITKSDKSTKVSRPVRADSYILISAGMDGLYGTEDDICNFDFKLPKQ